MLLFTNFMEKIFETAKKAVPDLERRDIDIDRSGHADFTLTLFRVSKKNGMKPSEIFGSIESAISGEGFLESVQQSGGYANFKVKPEAYFREVEESLSVKGQFPDIFQDPERISVEHTSANPTGPLHVGRARNSIIGDSLAKLLERFGYRVTTQYFINDSGRQVLFLYEAFIRYKKKLEPDDILDGYRRIYEDVKTDPSIEEAVKQLAERYERGDSALYEEIHAITDVMLEQVKSSLRELGIEHNDYTYESDFIQSGEIDQLLEGMDEYLRDEGGAKYVELPDDRKIFLKRSDGTSLYFARDIAYHLYKLANYDWLIDVLGEDHKLHASSLKYVMQNMLDIENRIDALFYGFVRLESGKMSTRKGNVVTLPDLIERMKEESYTVVKEKRPDLQEESLKSISSDVATSSIRFNIVRVGANKPMVFRWQEALNFEGDSAPYIMYSYARASSILRKAGELKAPGKGMGFNSFEADLAREMYFYPFFLNQAAESLRPDIIANYTLSLVKKFNDFYQHCTVLDENPETRTRRVSLVKLYRHVLEDACGILGIKVLEEM